METNTYAVAKDVLTETEKDRFLCCFLNIADTNNVVDWDKAFTDYGSASKESFRKMIQNALKKISVAEAKVANGEEPAKPKAKAGEGKKRKGDDAEDAAPKKKGRKGKKQATPAEDDEDAGGAVKAEENDED